MLNSGSAKGTVIVADDNEMNRALLADIPIGEAPVEPIKVIHVF
jgi:hypothetical protein